MPADLQFLASFDERFVKDVRYKRFEDFLSFPVQVNKGDQVARKLPADGPSPDGREGVRVAIEDGTELDSLIAERLGLSSDGESIISLADGYLCARGGKLSVTKALEIFGDATPTTTGNLSSIASIRVHGGVSGSVEIHSESSVEVLELVEEAWITARGNVLLKGGVTGGGKSVIKGDKDVYVTFAQQATIEAMGSFVADGPLLDCSISAGEQVVVRGSGSVVGGVTRARKRIQVPKAGSEGGAVTEIELGYNPFLAQARKERSQALEQARDEMEKREKAIQFGLREFAGVFEYDANETLSTLMSMTEFARDGGPEELDDERKEKFLRMASAHLFVVYAKDAVNLMEKDLESMVSEKAFSGASLLVEKIAHPGVKVSIVGVCMTLDQEYEKVKFVLKDEEIAPVWI